MSHDLDQQRFQLFVEQIRDLSGKIKELSKSVNIDIDFLPFIPDILTTSASYINAQAGFITFMTDEYSAMEVFGMKEPSQEQLSKIINAGTQLTEQHIRDLHDNYVDSSIREMKVDEDVIGYTGFINKESREGLTEFNELDHTLVDILGHQLELAASKMFTHKNQQSLLSLNRSVLNATSGAVVAVDQFGNLMLFNDKAAERFNLSTGDEGSSFLSRLPNQSPVRSFINDALENRTVKMASGLPLSASNPRIFRVYAAPFEYSKFDVDPMIFTFEDQTELNKVKETFRKYVSKDVLKFTLSNDHNIRLGGERRNCAIFFSDIRGFTNFSENKDPEDVVETLNQYFNAMIQPINDHNGSIDKLVGDEIMAVFHHEKENSAHPITRAINTALEMRNSLELFNSLRREQGLEQLYFGIGIHYGEVICGNIGSFDRMDYTIIGDNVNIAARFCSFARSDEIIVSNTVYELIKEDFLCEKMKPVNVKGKSQKLQVYSVIERKN